MKQIVSILLSVGLFAAGLPLHLCQCGCSHSVAKAKVEQKTCPHCIADMTNRSPDKHHPCRCEQCPDDSTLLPDDKTVVDTTSRLAQWLIVTTDSSTAEFACTTNVTSLPTPDHWPRGSDPSIPILLGHLLL